VRAGHVGVQMARVARKPDSEGVTVKNEPTGDPLSGASPHRLEGTTVGVQVGATRNGAAAV
jgi:hypothetical protein